MTEVPDLRLVPNPSEPPDPLIGQVLDGRYRIEAPLGEGGMGMVYKATHVVLQKDLALKVLKSEVSKDAQVIARFRREAQSATAIGSPHIIDISDFGQLQDGATYFVMEFLDGPSLGKALQEQRPMPTPRLVDIGIQLCEGLGAAHERGIVHRDLKPDNIHLVKQGDRQDFVKILDFGIAKVSSGGDKKLTQAGQVFGTPHYMSPEQCAGREVDRRTDIYALGVMLYEMATGRVPFDADNLMGVLTKHVYEKPIPPRELPPPGGEVPAALEAVILKCLEKAPEARYETMADLKADLEAIAKGRTPNAVADGLTMPKGSTQLLDSSSLPRMSMRPGVPSDMDLPKVGGGRTSAILLALGAMLLLLVSAAVVLVVALLPEGQLPGMASTTTIEDDPGVTMEADPDGDAVADVEEDAVDPDLPTGMDAPAVPAPSETISIVTTPEGAEVSVAGTLLGNSPVEVPRPAEGAVSVTITHAGYEDRSFSLSPSSQPSVRITLAERARRTTRTRARTRPPSSAPPRTSPPPRRRPSSGADDIVNPFD